MHSSIRVGLLGEFNAQQKAHQAIPKIACRAYRKAGWKPRGFPRILWTKGESLAEFHGLWCVPGMPYRSADGAISAIRFARTSHLPFLGTSAGFQYALIEYARHVLGLTEADHQKSNPRAAIPLITPLAVGLAGVKARVRFMEGTHLRNAYRDRRIDGRVPLQLRTEWALPPADRERAAVCKRGRRPARRFARWNWTAIRSSSRRCFSRKCPRTKSAGGGFRRGLPARGNIR